MTIDTEKERRRQRKVCLRLLKRWVPVAASEELALRKEGRTGPVIDEEPFEAGLKAGAFVLKLLERLARLDGLDAGDQRDESGPELADPLELAQRVRTVSPLLTARLLPMTPKTEVLGLTGPSTGEETAIF